MKTYTIEVMTDDGIETLTIKARNIKAAIMDTDLLSYRVFRYEGRKGEWNEYVEFDPRRSNRVTFIAQKGADGLWFVFENYPGRKGTVITHTRYQKKYLAVLDAQRRAHAAAQ